jgi:hypothetical protein
MDPALLVYDICCIPRHAQPGLGNVKGTAGDGIGEEDTQSVYAESLPASGCDGIVCTIAPNIGVDRFHGRGLDSLPTGTVSGCQVCITCICGVGRSGCSTRCFFPCRLPLQ